MKKERKNKSFRISAIAGFIFAVCGIFSSVCSAQTMDVRANNEKAAFAPREVRAVTQTTTPGQTITVTLATDAAGDESIYGFSLNYSTAILTYVPNSVMIGSGATRQAGGMCNVLENAQTAGRIGFSVDCNNSTITAGNSRSLVTLRFVVSSNAANGSTTPLTFGDLPASRSVSSNPAAGAVMSLPTTFTDGAVNIAAAAGANRVVRAVTQTTTPGQTITVVLSADTLGDESIYGFSLNYSTAILTYVPNSVMIGSGATRQAGGMCNVLENAQTAGQIGFSLTATTARSPPGNNRSLVTLRFTVAGNAPAGTTPLTFGDTPARRSVSSNPAAGAIMSLPTTFTDGAVNIGTASGRVVRVSSQDTSRSATVTVVLSANTLGDESIYGFSLNYNTAILTYVPNSVMIGSGATRQAGGMCDVLENANTAGRIGFSVDCSNSTITAGNNRRFVTLQFVVASNAPFGQTPLTFGDTPARRSVSSNPAAGAIMDLPTAFFDGSLNISSPTAATTQISGRISAAGRAVRGAFIYLTNSSGVTLTAQTNPFGYYRFNEVEVAETYTIEIRHKRYQFAPQVISVFGAVENLDFTAEPLNDDCDSCKL